MTIVMCMWRSIQTLNAGTRRVRMCYDDRNRWIARWVTTQANYCSQKVAKSGADWLISQNDRESNKKIAAVVDEGDKPSASANRLNLCETLVRSAPASVRPYLRLARFDKPIGTWLLFWPGGWGIAAASSAGCAPDVGMLALFGLGAMVMRSAGCTINDMWDRDIDARVARTASRPLANGDLTMSQAWRFLAVQLTVGLAVLLQLNWLSIAIGASSMFLIVAYPLMKRFTDWPQLVLGLTFNWGALVGYTACRDAFDPCVCLPIYASAVCWTIFYDTIYAHQDRADDKRLGIKSTAIRFGDATKRWLAGFGASTVAGLTVYGLLDGQTAVYYVSVAAVALHLAQQLRQLNVDDPASCGDQFVSNAAIGLIVFIGIVLGKLFKRAEEREAPGEQELPAVV